MRLIGIAAILLLLSACTVTETKSRNYDPARAAEANAEVGLVYLKQGNLAAANEKLGRALDQDDKNPNVHAYLALLKIELGLIEEARKHFKRALKLDPDNAGTVNNYGLFLCQQGEIEEAEKQFRRALLDPLYATPEYAWANAGACVLNIPDFAKAEDYLRKALQRNPTLPSALFFSAKLYYLKGKYAVANNYLDRYFKGSPKDAESLWLGLRLAWQTGERDKAKSYAFLLKKQYPDSSETQKLIQAESASPRRNK